LFSGFVNLRWSQAGLFRHGLSLFCDEAGLPGSFVNLFGSKAGLFRRFINLLRGKTDLLGGEAGLFGSKTSFLCFQTYKQKLQGAWPWGPNRQNRMNSDRSLMGRRALTYNFRAGARSLAIGATIREWMQGLSK
jgi:hypothetical protein